MSINKRSLFIILIILSAFWVHFWWFCLHPVSRSGRNGEVVYIRSGLSSGKIAGFLKGKGLIKNKFYFLLIAKIFDVDKGLKSGEYLFNKNMSTLNILHRLKNGMVLTHPVVIPEGYNIYQVARVLEQKGILSSFSLLKVCNDKELCRRLNIEADSVEGYLFPDTYFLAKDMNPEQIIMLMVNRFYEVLPEDAETLAKARNMSLHEIVILASLIEKETSDRKEMPLIAAVFYNRLRKGMPLQCDPSVLYAIGEVSKRLTKKDLQIDSPYNTYLNRGLPPGPIANPGLKAVKAALNPSELDYLYFVSQNNGTHYFSKSLPEHNYAVLKYQIRGEKPPIPDSKEIPPAGEEATN